ncbi:unnamed protein product, partial [Symbiodinium sp. KB8]
MPPAPPTSQSTQDTSEALAPLLETTLFVKPLTARDEALRAKAMESHRKAAIKKWMTLISVAGNAWEVARMSLLSDRPSDITGGLLQSVIDSLAGKATATLHARAGPLIRLVKFWADRGEVCFPVTEVQVYVFLKEVQDPAPTFPNSLLSSLRFARFTLGLIFVDGALESGRVRGVATQHYARKRRDVRRPALTVPQVKRLEDIVLDRGRGGHDRMAAGFFLFLVYGRLRYSDGLDVDDLADSSDGFLECTAERTKTQVGDAKKRKALPVVVPVASVDKNSFACVQWCRLAPQLLLGLETKGDIRVGTHSCKATALSWCAKYGLGHGPRKLLGYHIPRADRSMAVYSREELSSPVRSLVKVIREISSGNFDPDLTKSGLLARERRGSGGVELSESEGSKEDEHPVGSFECKAQIYESHLYDLLQALVLLLVFPSGNPFRCLIGSGEGAANFMHLMFAHVLRSAADRDLTCSVKGAGRFEIAGSLSLAAQLPVFLSDNLEGVGPRCAMSFADSKPVFQSRAAEIGLSNDDVKKLEEAGIVSMALFAFSCNYAPGGSDDKPFMEMIGRVLGDEPSMQQIACLRRLFAEAFSTVAAEIKSQTEASDDAPIKKLAAADRAQRLSEQQARLSGLRLRGNLEPGDGLVDKAVSVYESDRRGLALEQGNVISYANHDLLVEKLFEYRMMEAPPGFQKVSMKQLELADKRFWLLLAEHTRAGIKTTASGRPCDVNFTKCLDSTEFLSLLQHRPGAGGSSQQVSDGDEPPPKRPRWGKKGRGKGKNKSKGSASAQVPAALLALGCVAATPKGFPLCFDYSLDKCQRLIRRASAPARPRESHAGIPAWQGRGKAVLWHEMTMQQGLHPSIMMGHQVGAHQTESVWLSVFELVPAQELPRGSALEGAKAFSI